MRNVFIFFGWLGLVLLWLALFLLVWVSFPLFVHCFWLFVDAFKSSLDGGFSFMGSLLCVIICLMEFRR